MQTINNMLRRKARFPLPELTARVNGPSWRVTGFHYLSTQAVGKVGANKFISQICVDFICDQCNPECHKLGYRSQHCFVPPLSKRWRSRDYSSYGQLWQLPPVPLPSHVHDHTHKGYRIDTQVKNPCNRIQTEICSAQLRQPSLSVYQGIDARLLA